MLRDEDGIFLDDLTVSDVEKALNVNIEPVRNDGYEFIENFGENLNFKGEEYETIGSDSRQTERRKIDFV